MEPSPPEKFRLEKNIAFRLGILVSVVWPVNCRKLTAFVCANMLTDQRRMSPQSPRSALHPTYLDTIYPSGLCLAGIGRLQFGTGFEAAQRRGFGYRET